MMRDHIIERLKEAVGAVCIEVTDDSNHHVGHAGSREGGESHFSVTVVSPLFSGMTTVKRHRAVYDALAAELRESIHALRVTTWSPEEWASQT